MNITVKGVDSILKRLSKFDNMDAKLAEIARRLAAVGEPIIRAVHGNHNSVWSEQTQTGYRVIAEGESVLFIEFGTGDAAGIHAKEYDAVPSVVGKGTWSATHAQQYTRWGFWYWPPGTKNPISETPPHPAFYDAYQAMVQELPKIVEEVFQ